VDAPPYKSISPAELKGRLEGGEGPVLLDVREPWEFEAARIRGSRLVPMNELPERIRELDPEAEVVVICHHGARSAAVTRYLDASGFKEAYNLTGGLDAYSLVDGDVPRY
jgi:rhodanese-related sulfurtransferase